VGPAPDGSITLKAADAEIEGSAKLEERNRIPNIGFWLDPATTVRWNVDVPAGEYSVELSFAAETGSNGNEFQVVADNQSISGTIQATGSWSNFAVAQLGKLKLVEPVKTITVKPTKTSGPVMNLRWIKLTKAG
jgi:uncharacterized protein YndB with AHSA1/START domain